MCLIKTLQSTCKTGRTGKTTALYSTMMLYVSLMVRGLNKLDCQVHVSTIKLMVKSLFYLLVDMSSRLYALIYCARLDCWKAL